MTPFEIREETPRDHAEVDRIHEAAFGRRAEAQLVRSLRATARPQLSLLAVLEEEPVGHVFFSPVSVEGAGAGLAGLAPLAVAPARQGLGAGSALVRAGLDACPARGFQAVFVLGDPAYYARFGFTPAAAAGLHYGSGAESEALAAAFQVLELAAGVLSGCRGRVRYLDAFAKL